MATAAPVDNNPFTAPPPVKPVPVDHDPFAGAPAAPSGYINTKDLPGATPPVAGPNALFNTMPPAAPPVPDKPAVPGPFDIIDRAYGTPPGEVNPLTNEVQERPFELGRTATSLAEGANIKALEMLMLPLLLGTAAAQGGAKVLGLPPPTDYPAKIRQSFVEGQPVQPENAWERNFYAGGEQAMGNLPLAAATGPLGTLFSELRGVNPYTPIAKAPGIFTSTPKTGAGIEIPTVGVRQFADSAIPAASEGWWPTGQATAATIGRTAAVAPKATTAADVMSNIGSGVVGEWGGENFGPTGRLLGSAGGGVLYPNWVPTVLAARLGGKVAAKVLPSTTEAAANVLSPVLNTEIGTKLATKFMPSLIDARTGGIPSAAERGILANQYANREGQFADPNVPNPNAGSWINELLANAAQRQSGRLQSGIGKQLETYTSAPEAQAGLDEAAALRQQIPGFNPSVAKATGSQPLLNQERTIGTAATGEALTAMRDQAAQNAAAINAFAGGRVPPVTGAAPADQQVIDLLTAHAQAADRVAAQGPANIENRLRDVTTALPDRNVIETGTQIRGMRDVAERAMNTEVERRFAAVDPEGTFRAPTTNLYTSIVSRLNNIGTDLTNAVIPPKVRELLGMARPQTGLVEPGGQPVRWAPTYDINSLLAARREVNQTIRQYSGPSTTPEMVKARQTLHATLDGIDAEVARISEVTPPPGGPQITQQPRALETTVGGRPEAVAPGVPAPAEQPSTVQTRLADANRFYQNEYVPRFRHDLGRELGQVQKGTLEEAIKPEDIVTRLLAPNNPSEMRQFNLIHGENPAARDLMVNAALDNIRRKLGPSGIIGPDDVAGWVRSHSQILDEAPWLREALTSRDPSQLYQRLGQAEAARRATADENLTSIIGSPERPGLQPHEVIDTGLKDPRVMRQIAANARNAGPDAEAALRRAVWERAVGAGGGRDTTLPDPTKLREFLTNNEDSLRHVLSPEHKTDLETIARAAEIEGQLPPPRGAAEEPTTVSSVVQGLTGSGIPSILNKVFAFASGRVPKGYLGADVGLRVLNNFTEQEARRVWREALFNPDVARTVADGVRSGRATKAQTQKLKSYLLQAPGNAIEDVRRRQEEEQ